MAPRRGAYYKYRRAHLNVKAARGPASMHVCVDCDGRATDWSLNHRTTPMERIHVYRNGVMFSVSIEDYSPRCHQCHRIYDRGCDCTVCVYRAGLKRTKTTVRPRPIVHQREPDEDW